MGIKIENVGPIKELELPMEQGVVVVAGKNGSGKSTALAALSKMFGGGTSGLELTPTDGSKRGVLTFGEVELHVTPSRSRVTGELKIESANSRCDITDLVDPGIKDKSRADAARMKAIVALKRIKAEPESYYELCGGRDAYLDLDVEDGTDDPVLLATRVKKALQAQARDYQKSADQLAGRVKQINDQIAKADLQDCSEKDLEQINKQIEENSASLIELGVRKKVAKEELCKREQASAAISAAGTQDLMACKSSLKSSEDKLSEYRSELEELQERIKQQELDHSKLEGQLRVAAQLEAYKSIMESEAPNIDGILEQEESLAELNSELNAKKLTVSKSLEDAKAFEAIRSERDQLRIDVQSEMDSHDRQREAAKQVEAVLSSILTGSLRMRDDGRLVMPTDRSNEELFSELSDGERTRTAIDIAVESVEEGVLVLRQTAWESLAPSVKAEVHAYAKSKRVTVFAAEVTDGDLTAGVFSEEA